MYPSGTMPVIDEGGSWVLPHLREKLLPGGVFLTTQFVSGGGKLAVFSWQKDRKRHGPSGMSFFACPGHEKTLLRGAQQGLQVFKSTHPLKGETGKG
jgi:hypothetical protein